MKARKVSLCSSDGIASQIPPPTPLSRTPDPTTPSPSPTPVTSDEWHEENVPTINLGDDAELLTQQYQTTDTDQPVTEDDDETQEVTRLPTRKRSTKHKAPKSTQKRRKSAAVLLTNEQERDLAEWLELEVPFIYNKAHKDHVDKIKVNRAWEEKAASLDPPITGNQLSTWYDSVRTRFTKITKPTDKSGQGAQKLLTMREQWITQVFSFLKPHIIRQRRTNTLGLQVCTMFLSCAICCGCLHTSLFMS